MKFAYLGLMILAMMTWTPTCENDTSTNWGYDDTGNDPFYPYNPDPDDLFHYATISGSVTDSATGIAIPAAQLWIVELNYRTVTSAQGEYWFRSICPGGAYTLTASCRNYITRQQRLSVDSVGNFRLDFQLVAKTSGGRR